MHHRNVPVFGNQLHVKRAGNLQRRRHLVHGLADLVHRFHPDRLAGQHQGGITRVHARVLDVLADSDGTGNQLPLFYPRPTISAMLRQNHLDRKPLNN